MGILLAAAIWTILIATVVLFLIYSLRSRRQDPLDRAEDAYKWLAQDPHARRSIAEGKSGVPPGEISGVEAAATAVGRAAEYGGGVGNGLA